MLNGSDTDSSEQIYLNVRSSVSFSIYSFVSFLLFVFLEASDFSKDCLNYLPTVSMVLGNQDQFSTD